MNKLAGASNPIQGLVSVATRDFVAALKLLRLGLARRNAELLVSFTGTDLVLQFQGVDSAIPAAGRWTGTARITARSLIALTKAPPAGERLEVRYANGRFHVNRWSVAASWQDIAPARIEIPINASHLEIAALARAYSAPQLVASGLGPRIDGVAEEIRKCLDRAALALAPTGLTRSELEALLENKIRQQLASWPFDAPMPRRIWFPLTVPSRLRAALAVMIPVHKHHPTPGEHHALLESRIFDLVKGAGVEAGQLVEQHIPEATFYLDDDAGNLTTQIVTSDRFEAIYSGIDWVAEEDLTAPPGDVEDVTALYRRQTLASFLALL